MLVYEIMLKVTFLPMKMNRLGGERYNECKLFLFLPPEQSTAILDRLLFKCEVVNYLVNLSVWITGKLFFNKRSFYICSGKSEINFAEILYILIYRFCAFVVTAYTTFEL